MTSGRLGSHRFRFDPPHATGAGEPSMESLAAPAFAGERGTALASAIAATRDYLLDEQHDDGHWCAELQGDTILESEYILLLAFLGRANSEQARQAANYIRGQQAPHGGWAIYPGGPIEVSSSVKAYFALKLTGDSPDDAHMRRARDAILAAGGAERVNSFTRYYLALLGVISYEQCPAVPPEIMLIPQWMPFNIYEMSAWSRTIIVPLSLLWTFRPSHPLEATQGIRELFVDSPEAMPISMDKPESLDGSGGKSRVDWDKFFQRLDRTIKFFERLGVRPLRQRAIRRAAEWMTKRFGDSDGLGAIFPPIVWSVVALRCLGYPEDSSEVESALHELEKLMIRQDDTVRLQPCKSPVWDTAICILALREAGLPAEHGAIRSAAGWLVSKEVREPGDWMVLNRNREPGGWFFEYRNRFYPDVDDTGMVLMALHAALPRSERQAFLSADFFVGNRKPGPNDTDAAAVVATRGDGSAREIARDIENVKPHLTAIHRGLNWLLAMQNRDGGWGAFDVDNDRELFTRVPFADHNAMIDPSTVDLAARVLECFGRIGVSKEHPAVARAIEYVWSDQEADHCWYGRWGVNYIYGTWQAIVGLATIGVPAADKRIQAAADWLESKQHTDGAWGETPATYNDPTLRGTGPATASQTAWALMGLMAAGRCESEAVQRGVDYLLETQCEDGTWDEEAFTGTGFPEVFYLKYHYYRIYFPLMALARYARLKNGVSSLR